MTKWEYKIAAIDHASPDDIEAELNELGAEGWELIQILIPEMPMRAGASALVLKRPADG